MKEAHREPLFTTINANIQLFLKERRELQKIMYLCNC